MTPQQLTTLKAAILAETDVEFVGYRDNGQTGLMAGWFNAAATPAYYVKRTSLSRHEILTGTSDDLTTFAWAAGAYITRSQGERDAFREMFNSTGSVNPALPSIQAAFSDIFSGVGGAGNRAHITAMSRRQAKRGEQLFAVGSGTKASPSVLGFEGDLTDSDISASLSA